MFKTSPEVISFARQLTTQPMIFREYKFITAARLLAIMLLVNLSACTTLGYYTQSMVGHVRLMSARQPIEKLIDHSGGVLKEQLALALEIRKFAVEKLFLPDNESYLYFVDMQREYPVWNVVASNELSLRAKQWCYPLVGCATYRGYFAKSKAESYAQGLAIEGYDTTVSGVSAYSTLGWFDDPLIPSMMRYGVAEMAEIIFHELAHQRLYIKGNSEFNEAFATVVGEHGAVQWLKNRGDLKGLALYQQRLEVSEQFYQLLKATKQRLEVVYQSAISDDLKRQQKQHIFAKLVKEYQTLKSHKWEKISWFDKWFEKPLNNARLVSFSTYRELVPKFKILLNSCGEIEDFYAKLRLQKHRGEAAAVPVVCDS